MIRFGVFTDLHYDHVFDGDRRVDEILEAFEKEKLDFMISLGDLCYPIERNQKLLERIEQSGVPVYYVIGNHDSDQYSQDEVCEFLHQKRLYDSFVIEDTKFIILNTCYMVHDGVEYPFYQDNYRKNSDVYPVVPRFEIDWLEEEMMDPKMKYVIFSHHSLANEFSHRGIANRVKVHSILKDRKTILCMNGHDHGDDCKVIHGIPYYTLNSCSYIWQALKEVHPFSEEIHKQYPGLKNMILYQSEFHTIVEIDHKDVRVQGMQGEYMNITPEDVGIVNRRWNGVSVEPVVTGYRSH